MMYMLAGSGVPLRRGDRWLKRVRVVAWGGVELDGRMVNSTRMKDGS